MFSLTTAPPDIALQHLVLGICPSDDFQCTLNEAGHSILLSNNLTMCVERELSRHNPSIPVARSPRRCALVRLIFLPLNTPFGFLEAEFVFFLQPVDFFLCVTALCNGLAVPSYWCGGMHEASGLPYVYGVVNLNLLFLSLVSVVQSLLPPYLLPLLYQRETLAL